MGNTDVRGSGCVTDSEGWKCALALSIREPVFADARRRPRILDHRASTFGHSRMNVASCCSDNTLATRPCPPTLTTSVIRPHTRSPSMCWARGHWGSSGQTLALHESNRGQRTAPFKRHLGMRRCELPPKLGPQTLPRHLWLHRALRGAETCPRPQAGKSGFGKGPSARTRMAGGGT